MLKLNQLELAAGKRLASFLMLGAVLTGAMGSSPVLASVRAKYVDFYDFTGDNGQYTPFGAFAQAPSGKLYGALFINDSMIYNPAGKSIKVDWDQANTGNVCGYAMAVGPDGALYGTCTEYQDNSNDGGIVFRFDPSQRRNNFTVLYSFPAQNEGRTVYPSPLTLGTDGNFYGTTAGDSTNEYGTVFQITPQGSFSTIHVFQGGADDGAAPSHGGTDVGNAIGLTLGSDGNFYGTTDSGGANGTGTVYQVTPGGNVTVIYSFNSPGICPCTGVTEANGNFYGQSFRGGTNSEGTIFEVTPGGTMTTLHNFDLSVDSAGYPSLPFTLGSDGNLYSASPSFTGGYGPESVYRITPSGTYTDLYDGFAYPDGPGCSEAGPGCFVQSPPYQATNGRFYGVTMWGGANEDGSVFSLTVRGADAFVRPIVSVAKPGQWLGILGQGFTGATNVSFSGKTAAFRVKSDTYLEARVPLDATKGRITVTTGTGDLRSNTDFSPLR